MFTQEVIVIVTAESNRPRQSQPVGTTFREPALFDAFGPYADNEEQ